MKKKMWIQLFESGSDGEDGIFWSDFGDSLDFAEDSMPDGATQNILYGWYEHGRFNEKRIRAQVTPFGRVFAFLYELPDSKEIISRFKRLGEV